jgi:hypothetical protein
MDNGREDYASEALADLELGDEAQTRELFARASAWITVIKVLHETFTARPGRFAIKWTYPHCNGYVDGDGLLPVLRVHIIFRSLLLINGTLGPFVAGPGHEPFQMASAMSSSTTTSMDASSSQLTPSPLRHRYQISEPDVARRDPGRGQVKSSLAGELHGTGTEPR